MKLLLEQLLNVPGAEQSFAGELNLSEAMRHGEVLFPELLAVAGTVINRAGVVSLRYQISGSLPFLCDRCLMQTQHKLTYEFTHIVVRSLEDESLEDAYLVCPDGVLIIEEIAQADLLLKLPQVLLCREDCMGLCPKCGANLNTNRCECVLSEPDSRLEKLRQLLED